jgi:hypothetical protein
MLLSARLSGLSLAKDTADGTFAETSQPCDTCQPMLGFRPDDMAVKRGPGGAKRGLAVPPQQCSGTPHCMTRSNTAQPGFRSCLDSKSPLMDQRGEGDPAK